MRQDVDDGSAAGFAPAANDGWSGGSALSLVKSKQRMNDHGEVFTPAWLVDAMLDQIKAETERIDSRFLEPACGDGNFLRPVLKRKLAAVEAKYRKSEFEVRQFALLALMSIYGVELLADNVAECRHNLVQIFDDYLGIDGSDDAHRAAVHVVGVNIVRGDALAMKTVDGRPIAFAEWGYLGRGRFQRRDFRLDTLAQSSAFGAEDTLFADLGKHEIFTPTRTYAPATIAELAA
ncbi:MAG: N-6 DNA methylase [Marmoricola sp.]